jgi:PAS domain S-box-containing protein
MSTRTDKDETTTLRNVLDNLVDGVVVIDQNGNFLYVNEKAVQILEPGSGALDLARWTEYYRCYYPDQITPYPLDRLPLYRAARGEEVQDELIYMRGLQQPSSIWINASGRPLRNGDGSVWGGMAIIRDVTGEKRTEEKLNSTSSRFAALIENQQTGILVENEKRCILEANQAFCDLFTIAVSPAELAGADCNQASELAKSMFAEPDEFIRRTKRLLENRLIVTNERLPLADGRVFERDYIPVFFEGKYRGSLWQYRDITAREKARESFMVFETLYSALEQTADSVVITDRSGRIEYVNSGFEITTGYSRDEVLGKTPRILKSGVHDDAFYKNLWQQLSTGQMFRGTIVNRKKSGELYWSQQTITPVADDGGTVTHYVSVLKDITELLKQKEQEVEMRLAREVQQQFFRTTASVPGFDIVGSSFPALETGGDYFDFITMPDGYLGIAIGDVSGHGVASAIMMAEMRAYLRSYATSCTDVGEIMTRLNQQLEPDLTHGRFVTLLFARLDPGRRELTYASAGHVPGFLLGKSGNVGCPLESTAPPLGVLPDLELKSSEIIQLEPGQIILLTTDGILDSMADEDTEFGMTRAVEYVGDHRTESAGDIVTGLYRATQALAPNQSLEDDASLIILKVGEDSTLPH